MAHGLPVFPIFHKLRIKHMPFIDKAINGYPPFSDFALSSIYSWNIDGRTHICTLNNNLVLKMKHYTDNRNVYSFIGKNKPTTTIRRLLTITNELNLIPSFSVPKQTNKFSDFTVHEDKGNHDYILSTKRTSLLNTNYTSKKRYKALKFLRENPAVSLTPFEPKREKVDVLAMFDRWATTIKKNSQHTKEERIAISNILNLSKHFKLVSLAMYLNGEMIAFSINEQVSPYYLYGLFTKADTRYKGITEYFIQQQSRFYRQHGIRYINIAQDLGIKYLREFKTQWRPVKFLKKYTIKKTWGN